MQLRFFSTLFCVALVFNTFARLHDNAYRSVDNPYYWQNRMPDNAYWQQDVAYKILAIIDEDSNMIHGAEVLTYWNNSPDTLNEVYFHLFQNAFVKGSHLHNLELANNVKPHLGKMEEAGLGIIPENIEVNGNTVKTILDNTIMKVLLPVPLYPGGKIQIKMTFRTYYDNGATRRRMQMYNAWGFMHYNGTQWFPKICVYDRMHGWDTYQHLNKEFYGDFGLYDVTLDFPSNYIVEASGELQNRKDVLPDTLRQKLDIKNFATKKWNEPPSIIIPYIKGQRKEWHFVANNVHDFAFTADPSFRIGTTYWNNIECVALVQEPHAANWQNAPDYVSKIIKTFSEGIGMYCYPKIVAADAQDGMEYPMLTLDGGYEPNYRGLFVHEIGHNWFYGQVGSNETYRAAMDEGFTQYLTAYGLRHIDGENMVVTPSTNRYRNFFAEPQNVLDRNVLNSYTLDALNQNETPINTHSDDFSSALNHGGNYREVYYKTASMLYNLEYVLGDSLFATAMHHYFEQWKFAHPYFEDFRASIIQYTHVDLSWFFDEWFETTKTIDYAIGNIHKINGTDSISIKFIRKGEMQMPIDFTVTGNNGKKYNFHIPNTWFQKQTDATILPKWYGWGKLNKNYTAHVQIPTGIKSVQTDTTYRLADKNYIDNYKGGIEGQKLMFESGLNTPIDRRHFRWYMRPDIWWNAVDGLKIGYKSTEGYLNTLQNRDYTIWWNTRLLFENDYKSIDGKGRYSTYSPISFTYNYLSAINVNTPKTQLQYNIRYLDGLWFLKAGFNRLISENNTISFFAQTMWRNTDAGGLSYLTDPADWSSVNGKPNSSANIVFNHRYSYFNGIGKFIFTTRTPLLTNNFDYSYIQMENINSHNLGKLNIRTRVFGRYGMGNNIPYESALYMAGANPEEQMDNKYSRSVGFIPMEWQGESRYNVNHYQMGGGLNLRGYAGYFAPDTRGGTQMEAYKGRSGAAANLEIGFDNLIKLKPRITRNWLKCNLYLFGDAGFMEMSNFSLPNFTINQPNSNYWSNLHADAGAGIAFTIRNWAVFEKAKPLTLRLDLPVFLNRPPYSNTDYATLRYVVGVGRAF